MSIVLAGGDPGARSALTTAFRHSLGRSGIEATIFTVPKMNPHEVVDSQETWPGQVVMWLDLGAPKAATLYVTEGRSVFTRRLSLIRDFDPVALDLLDVVVTNAAEAILAGKQLGVPREEFKRSLERAAEPTERGQPPAAGSAGTGDAPVSVTGSAAVDTAQAQDRAAAESAPSLPPADRVEPMTARASAETVAGGEQRTWSWSVAAVYAGGMLAGTQGFHGPGLNAAVETAVVSWAAEVSHRFPYEISAGGANISLRAETLRLSAARLFHLGAHLVGSVAAGVGADLTHVSAVATDSGTAAAPSFWALDPALRSSLGLESRQGRLRVGLMGGVDVDLVAPRYVEAGPATVGAPATGTGRSLWVPWRWRPYAAVTVGFSL